MRRSKFLLSALFSCLVLSSSQSLADNPMKSIFSGIVSNSTSSGSFQTNKTMGWSGGGYSYRVPNVSSPNIISIVPPKANVGCNGADFFLGSFSLINKDELVQIMRGIANGSAVFAFNVAMDAVCPTCIKEMQEIQNKLEKFNEAARNSCQATLNALNTSLGPEARAVANQNALIKPGTISMGLYSDTGETDAADQGSILENFAKTTGGANYLKENVETNLTFAALNYLGVSNWRVAGNTGYDWTELLISLFGTVVLTYDATNKTMTPKEYPPTISLLKLVEGASTGESIQFYHCNDSTDCLAPTKQTQTNWQGLREYVLAQLDTLQGYLVAKDATNLATMTGFINMFPASDIEILERTNANNRESVIEGMADRFTYSIVGQIVKAYLRRMGNIGIGTKSTVGEYMTRLPERKKEVTAEADQLELIGLQKLQKQQATVSLAQSLLKFSGLK